MGAISYMGQMVAGSIPIDDTDSNPFKTMSSEKIDKGIVYETPCVTQTNGKVTFDNLNPNYKYELGWNTVGADGVDVVDPTGSDHIDVPSYTLLSKTAGTNSTAENPTSKLVYKISGGTDNISRFFLSYVKG